MGCFNTARVRFAFGIATVMLAACGGHGDGSGGDPAPAVGQSETFAVTVVRDGTGSGWVAADSLSCGTACSTRVRAGTELALHATPDPGSEWESWSVPGCTGPVCTITAHSDVVAHVSFKPSAISNPPVTHPPPSAICGETCHALADEFVPDSQAVRATLGFALDNQGRPRIALPAPTQTCLGGANKTLDAVRIDGHWSTSAAIWDRAVVLANGSAGMAALTGAPSPTTFLLLGAADAWSLRAPPGIDTVREGLLVADGQGRFHAIGSRSDGNGRTSVYSVWDGAWTSIDLPQIPAEDTFLAMAVQGSGDPVVAFWDMDAGGLTQTLKVGDPRGAPHQVATSARLGSPLQLTFAAGADGEGSHQVLTQLAERRDPSAEAVTKLAWFQQVGGAWIRTDIAENVASNTLVAVDAWGVQHWNYDEWTYWPVAVLVREGAVRVVYTSNHLTGEVTFTPQAGGWRISGGVNAASLMIAWMSDGHLRARRVADGFLHWTAGSPFPGRARPLVAAALDSDGVIHVAGEALDSPTSACASSIRYVAVGR